MIDTARNALFAMDGDALYVWGSVAAALALIALELALLAASGRDLAARRAPR